MTPARIAVAAIIAICILVPIFVDPWSYTLYAVLLVVVILAVATLVLALTRSPVDTAALKLLAAVVLLFTAPRMLSAALEALGVDTGRFFPYRTKTVWEDSLRVTIPLWGAPLAATVLIYAYRAARRPRSFGAPRLTGWILLVAGLPTWVLLPTILFDMNGGDSAMGLVLCLPWMFATLTAQGLAFAALDSELGRRQLARIAVLSTGMALFTLVLLAAVWTGVADRRPYGHEGFWAAPDWNLLRWEELGPHFTLLSASWLALGIWMGYRWTSRNATHPSTAS
jgi:hypothetical protein